MYSNVFDTAVKADVFGDTFFGLSKSFISLSELPESSVMFALMPFTPSTHISDSYFGVTHIDRFDINVVIVTACGVVQFLHNRLFVDCSVCGFAVLYM